MTYNILPTTRLGRWSVGLIIAMLILLFIGMSFTTSLYPTVSAGSTILADIAKRPALALTMLAGFASGILAFLIGLNAVMKQNEHSISVYIAIIVGALLIWCLLAEIFYPH